MALIATYASLIIGNLTLGWLVWRGQTDLEELLWLFWLQSVLIGVAAAVRMALLRQFSTEGLLSNGKLTPETAEGKQSCVGFFCLHYGFFHVIYAVFLGMQFGAPRLPESAWEALALATLVAGEAWGLVQHVRSDRSWRPNLGTLMMTPYARIVPMHLAIISSGFMGLGGREDASGLVVALFLGLKTCADAGLQYLNDRMDAQRRAKQTESPAEPAAE